MIILSVSLSASDVGDTQNHVTVGNSHAKRGDYQQALATLNTAIQNEPNSPRAYKLRGHVYYAMGDYNRAYQDLDKVVSLAPTSANAYADRAILNSVLGRHGQALTDVEHALRIKPDSHFAKAVRDQILQNASQGSK